MPNALPDDSTLLLALTLSRLAANDRQPQKIPVAVAVRSRLFEFLALPAGWYNGEGKTYESASLEWLASTFAAYYPGDLLMPRLYPIPDGGISLEWMSATFEGVIGEINLEAKTIEVMAGDARCGSSVFTLDLSTVTGWGGLVRAVRTTKV